LHKGDTRTEKKGRDREVTRECLWSGCLAGMPEGVEEDEQKQLNVSSRKEKE